MKKFYVYLFGINAKTIEQHLTFNNREDTVCFLAKTVCSNVRVFFNLLNIDYPIKGCKGVNENFKHFSLSHNFNMSTYGINISDREYTPSRSELTAVAL